MRNILFVIGFVISFYDSFGQNNSQFIAQTTPTEVDTNEVFNVSVTFENTGASTWKSSEGYKLGTQSPQDNDFWGVGNRVALSNDVAPGQQVTFNINLKAPATSFPYGYPLQWQMLKEGVEWFGDKSEARIIVVGANALPDSLLTNTKLFTTSSHVVGTSMFHWYGENVGQLSSPWLPIEGRDKWTGEVDFWKRMIKQAMVANIDVFYVLVIPSMEQERINLFRALNELRREGWDVPKICPFFDPIITYTIKGINGDASTVEGKDEIVSHYIRFYHQYYSQNSDEFADDFIYTLSNKPVLDVWHVHLNIDNYPLLSREDVESRLSSEFGDEHPIFNNGIYMITTANSPTFSFADEKTYQFEVHEYYKERDYNGILTSQIKPGYWDQNIRNPGYFLPRDGGRNYKDAWAKVSSSVDRIYIESFNEYDEGSGIYAARTDTVFIKKDGGMNNTETDIWSTENNPYDYLKTTAEGAALFNDIDSLGAKILWHNIPQELSRSETFIATIVVRNSGNEQWSAAKDFEFGEIESLDPVLFGPARYLIDDTQDEIPEYGGIFRGRVKVFNIEITAPDTAGTFDTHWGMVRENMDWFGDTIETSITVLESYYINEKETICAGDSILWHGNYLTESGIYYDSLFTNSGIDSICRLDLSVETLDVSVTQNGAVLQANLLNAEYQWINCVTFDSIEGETSREFIASENGDYAVIITKGRCTYLSDCFNVSGITAINENRFENEFVVYPNPVSFDDIVHLRGEFRKSDRVFIVSPKGNRIFEKEILYDMKSLNLSLPGINASEGIYFIQIVNDNGIQTRKIIVRR